MAVYAAIRRDFSSNGKDTRTFALNGHLVTKPRILIQRRRVPVGTQKIAENVTTFVYGSEDANGDMLTNPSTLEIKHRFHIDAISADASGVINEGITFVISDEFAANWQNQFFVDEKLV